MFVGLILCSQPFISLSYNKFSISTFSENIRATYDQVLFLRVLIICPCVGLKTSTRSFSCVPLLDQITLTYELMLYNLCKLVLKQHEHRTLSSNITVFTRASAAHVHLMRDNYCSNLVGKLLQVSRLSIIRVSGSTELAIRRIDEIARSTLT